jgi:hypothetical protein
LIRNYHEESTIRKDFLNYKKARHLELLTNFQNVKSNLSSPTPPLDSRQLSNYSNFLDSELDWLVASQYYFLQEDLLFGKIDMSSFIERADLDRKIVEKLESNLFLLKLNQKVFEFSDIMSQILDLSLSYSYDPDHPKLETLDQQTL